MFLQYISKRQSSYNPYFAWLHLMPPHPPYLPPPSYIGIFGEPEKFVTEHEQSSSGLLYEEYTPDRQPEVDILRKRYNEFILYSDNQFELFLSRLAETTDMSNTIVILTSDHGESFSHGFCTHSGKHLYEPLVRIPLIMKIPGVNGGHIIDMPVEQADIAPTILNLIGIPVPEWMEGRSLSRLIEGETLQPRPVYTMELIKNRSFGHPITKGTIAVRDGNYKLIYYLEKDQKLLFNLKSDPDEKRNLSYTEPEIRDRLLKLIINKLTNINDSIMRSSTR